MKYLKKYLDNLLKRKMKKSNIFKRFVGSFGWFTAIPAFIAWVGGKIGYNEIFIFIVSVFLGWIIYTELRIQDLTKNRTRRKR